MTVVTTSLERRHRRFDFGLQEPCEWWAEFSDRLTGRYRKIGDVTSFEVAEKHHARCGFLWLRKEQRIRYVWVDDICFRRVRHGYTDRPEGLLP